MSRAGYRELGFTNYPPGYSTNNSLSDLEWRIRAGGTASVAQSLMQYVRDKAPEDCSQQSDSFFAGGNQLRLCG